MLPSKLKVGPGTWCSSNLLVHSTRFDSQEGQTQNQGERQIDHLLLALAQLGGAYCHHHGQAAADEYGGVDRAQSDVERVAGGGEVGEVPETVDEIGAEHAAEEHDFGRQKQPHAQ